MPFSNTRLADTVPLNLPEPAVARHPDLITRPRELRQWLAELPLFDPEQLVRQLCRQLSLLVADPEPDSQFTKLLHSYHPLIGELQQQVAPIRQTPAESRAHAQAQLVRALPHLYRHLADGHARAVWLCMQRGRPPHLEDLFTAMLLNHREIFDAVCEYRPVEADAWQQSVQLYNIATLYSLQGKAADSALRLPDEPDNAHNLFLSTLGLLLADPYRLPARCVTELNRRLPRLVAGLEIDTVGDPRQQLPLDLSGQTLPLQFARQPDPALPAHYLPLEDLLQQLQTEEAEDDCRLDPWLRDSLQRLLEAPPKRRHPRQPRQVGYDFVTGLEAIHRRLRALQPGLNSGGKDDCAPSVCGTPCTQIDVSASGASFVLDPKQHQPEPGEWGLFELDDPNRSGTVSGFVGRIRRCRRDDNDALHIGVERLLGGVIPITLGALHKPALFNADPSRSLYQLIAPSGYYEPGLDDRLEGSNKSYQVRHLRLLARDAHSDLIELERLN